MHYPPVIYIYLNVWQLNFRYVDQKDMLHVASAVDPCFIALSFLPEEEQESTFSRLQAEAVDGMEEEASDVSNRSPVEKIQVNPCLPCS